MTRVVTMLSAAVRRAPAIVLVVAFLVTAVMGGFATQVVQGGGNEGFSPDNPELLALDRIQEVFGSNGNIPMQVLLTAEPGTDLLGEAGVEVTTAMQETLLGSEEAELLATGGPEQPTIITPVGPAMGAAMQQDMDPTTLDADTVRDLLAQLPPEQAEFVTSLVADGKVDGPVETALAVVMLDSSALPDDDIEMGAEVQRVADRLDDVSVDGVTLEPFAFPLLFSSFDSFQDEIGRLFGMAFLIIVLILAFVYMNRPGPDSTWPKALRRTAADVSLTMLVVLMAITWVQGAAGLLGPKVLGWIGALAETGQIVPVLMIGLGVDYGIHLTSRYREEAGTESVQDAIGRATRTVGVALVLATITTTVGFLTNLTAPVPALVDFGILAAVGIVAAFLLMLTVFPAARQLLDRRAEANDTLPRQTLGAQTEGVLPRLMEKVSVLAQKAAIPTLVVTVGVGGALGVLGFMNLSTEFSFTDFLPEDDPLVQTFNTINEEFGGGVGETTTLVAEGEITPEVETAMEEVLADLAGTDGVVTRGDAAVATPARTGSDEAGGILTVEVSTDAGEAGAGPLGDRLNAALEPVAAELGEDGSVVATSDWIVSARITDALRESQLRSLFIAIAAAMALLVLTYWVTIRRPLLGVITIAPVALVVLWTFGMMAATGIPVGPVTATIAALAVGIGVPYTIHVTNRWREDRQTLSPTAAIRETVSHTGGALAGSAFTTVAGFGVLVTSTLTPFQQFGLVTAYSIGFSLVAATVVLPSMLVLYDRWLRRNGHQPGPPLGEAAEEALEPLAPAD